MKKHFITGFISGALIFGVVGALAATYTATDNPFPIKLNGNDVQMEGYNIEGSTYFKLRDIADVVGGFEVGFQDNTIQLSKDGYQYSNTSYINLSGQIWANNSADDSSFYSLDFREDGTVYKTSYHAVRIGTYAINENKVTVHLTQFGDDVIDETYEYLFDANFNQMICTTDSSVLKETSTDYSEQALTNNMIDAELQAQQAEKQAINKLLDEASNKVVIVEDDWISENDLKEKGVIFKGGSTYVPPEVYGELGFFRYMTYSGGIGKMIYALPNFDRKLFAEKDVVTVDGITIKRKSTTYYFNISELRSKGIL